MIEPNCELCGKPLSECADQRCRGRAGTGRRPSLLQSRTLLGAMLAATMDMPLELAPEPAKPVREPELPPKPVRAAPDPGPSLSEAEQRRRASIGGPVSAAVQRQREIKTARRKAAKKRRGR